MVDHVLVTKQYAKLVGIVHGLLAILYLPSGKFLFCGLLILEAAAIIVPGMLLTREDNAKIVARYMLTVSSISVMIMQRLAGSYESTVPLFLCIGALAALHFDPHLVIDSFAVNFVYRRMCDIEPAKRCACCRCPDSGRAFHLPHSGLRDHRFRCKDGLRIL